MLDDFGEERDRIVCRRQRAGSEAEFAIAGQSDGMDLSRWPRTARLMFFGGRVGRRMGWEAGFFRDLDSTKQWAESQWDRVRTVGGPSPSSLIGINPFWAGRGCRARKRSTGVSTHLLRPIENRHAALTALAMCGLPLVAPATSACRLNRDRCTGPRMRSPS